MYNFFPSSIPHPGVHHTCLLSLSAMVSAEWIIIHKHCSLAALAERGGRGVYGHPAGECGEVGRGEAERVQ